jgi:cysteinyl-tRNA synthetase
MPSCAALSPGCSGEAGAQALAATTQGPSSPAPVVSALLDDLNTPAALAELSAPLKAINDLLTTKAGRKAPNR